MKQDICWIGARYSGLFVAGTVDPARPLIYAWRVAGELVYVGKAKDGEHRPRTGYRRTIVNLLDGKPYRKGNPDKYRHIHRAC
jgi:hypothetical protein